MKYTIYHNPKCRKSRETLAILEANNIEPDIILYLHHPPSKSELKKRIHQLGCAPHDLIRTEEPLYKEQFKGLQLSDDEWLNVMMEHPILIQRPIVTNGKRTIVGRPPENVLTLL